MLYIVTRSNDYYPSAGTYDWEFVTADEAAARAFYAGIEVDNYSLKFLISIDPVGTYRTLEEA